VNATRRTPRRAPFCHTVSPFLPALAVMDPLHVGDSLFEVPYWVQAQQAMAGPKVKKSNLKRNEARRAGAALGVDRLRRAGSAADRVSRMASRTPLAGPHARSRAEQAAVGSGARPAYLYYTECFHKWCVRESRTLKPSPDMVWAMLDYIDVLLDDGYAPDFAEKSWAAIRDEFPALDTLPKGMLVRVSRALRGFRKTCPKASRAPMPHIITCGKAMIAAARGEYDTAELFMVSEAAYLRPGEARGLRATDLLPPVPGLPQC
jgi:hypothetical protein